MALPGKDHHDPIPGLTPESTATTADGEVLGSLKGATETSFKVDAENARDYWLNRGGFLGPDATAPEHQGGRGRGSEHDQRPPRTSPETGGRNA